MAGRLSTQLQTPSKLTQYAKARQGQSLPRHNVFFILFSATQDKDCLCQVNRIAYKQARNIVDEQYSTPVIRCVFKQIDIEAGTADESARPTARPAGRLHDQAMHFQKDFLFTKVNRMDIM